MNTIKVMLASLVTSGTIVAIPMKSSVGQEIQIQREFVQTRNTDIVGEWYQTRISEDVDSKGSFLKNKLYLTKIFRRNDGLYNVQMKGKNWLLQRQGNAFIGRRLATAVEIQEKANILTAPGGRIPFSMAQAAEKQKAIWFTLTIQMQNNGKQFYDNVRLEGKPYNYQGKRVVYVDVTPIVSIPWKRKPLLSSTYDWVKYIDNHNGYVDFSFRELYREEINKNRFGLLYLSDGNENGHSYLAINSLGKSRLLPEIATDILKKNVETVFPCGAQGQDGKSTVKENVNFILMSNCTNKINEKMGEFLSYLKKISSDDFKNMINEFENVFDKFKGIKMLVNTISDNKLHFTFKVEETSQHPLKGTAIHGIFKDDNGELFLFQQGRGTPTENNSTIGLSIGVAPVFWISMAHNLKELIESDSTNP
jgi:hypothetical protein